ncbi:MAG TPA: hypothetical protein PLU49_09100 [Saprospiraceae bacterium]|nr:hypothetical protein [Saprospirales bacterium]HRQ30214.1 hypothetical protein [Saprospiraceae bacterium]
MNKIALLIIFLLSANLSNSQSTKTHKLMRDTIVKVGNTSVMFLRGTDITIKDRKNVISGTLANNLKLYSAAKKDVFLSKNTKVVFNANGKVISGTLHISQKNICFPLPRDPNRCIQVLEGSYFSLYDDGTFQSGTLKNIAGFKPSNSKTLILFLNNGLVYLRDDGTIKSGYLYKELNSKWGQFRGGCYIEFDEKGDIVKGVRNFNFPNTGKFIIEHIEFKNGTPYRLTNKLPCECES